MFSGPEYDFINIENEGDFFFTGDSPVRSRLDIQAQFHNALFMQNHHVNFDQADVLKYEGVEQFIDEPKSMIFRDKQAK